MAGLAPAARTLVETAEVLVGGARHLAMVPDTGAERLAWGRPLVRDARRHRGPAGPEGGRVGQRRPDVVRHRRHPGAPLSARGDDDPAAAGRLQPRRRAGSAGRWPNARRSRCTAGPIESRAAAPRSGPPDTGPVRGRRHPKPGCRAVTPARLGTEPSRCVRSSGRARRGDRCRRSASWGDRGVPDLNTIAVTCRRRPAPAPCRCSPGFLTMLRA